MIIRKRYIMNAFDSTINKQIQTGNASFSDDDEKIVFILDRKNMELLAACNVDKITGDWRVSIPSREDEKLISMCRDEGAQFNSDIYDRTSLCTTTYNSTTYHDNLVI